MVVCRSREFVDDVADMADDVGEGGDLAKGSFSGERGGDIADGKDFVGETDVLPKDFLVEGTDMIGGFECVEEKGMLREEFPFFESGEMGAERASAGPFCEVDALTILWSAEKMDKGRGKVSVLLVTASFETLLGPRRGSPFFARSSPKRWSRWDIGGFSSVKDGRFTLTSGRPRGEGELESAEGDGGFELEGTGLLGVAGRSFRFR